MLALAKIAAAAGGGYASHIRSEDRDFWDAIDEVIAIGRQHRMPVHVSHLKLGMHDLWGQAAKLIGVLDRARSEGVQLTADIYPYTYWQSNLGVLYPKRNFADAGETEFVLAHVALADDIIFNSFRAHPDYAGKTLAQVAALRGTPAARALMDLLAEPGGASAGIVAKGMSDGDVERLVGTARAQPPPDFVHDRDYRFDQMEATRAVNDEQHRGTIRLVTFVYRPLKTDRHRACSCAQWPAGSGLRVHATDGGVEWACHADCCPRHHLQYKRRGRLRVSPGPGRSTKNQRGMKWPAANWKVTRK